MFNKLLEKSREITPEGMKRVRQNGNSTVLWMYLLVKVKYDAVKIVICCKYGTGT